jgi:hypothetical protein
VQHACAACGRGRTAILRPRLASRAGVPRARVLSQPHARDRPSYFETLPEPKWRAVVAREMLLPHLLLLSSCAQKRYSMRAGPGALLAAAVAWTVRRMRLSSAPPFHHASSSDGGAAVLHTPARVQAPQAAVGFLAARPPAAALFRWMCVRERASPASRVPADCMLPAALFCSCPPPQTSKGWSGPQVSGLADARQVGRERDTRGAAHRAVQGARGQWARLIALRPRAWCAAVPCFRAVLSGLAYRAVAARAQS